MQREDSAAARPGLVALAVIAGWLVALLMLSPFVDLVRNRLHFLCSFARMGSDDPGDWVCADGISYLGVAIASFLVLSAVTLVALVIAASVGMWRATRHQGRLLLALGPAPVGWVLTSTAYAATAGHPHGWSTWSAALLPVLVGAAVVVVAAVAAAFLPRTPADAALGTAAIALGIAGLRQPDVAWALLDSGALLLAARLADHGGRG